MSLLMRMIEEPFFHDKKILVIDHSQKTANDRTWCFWEKEAGVFESIVTHRWEKADFFSKNFSATLDLLPYTYKMIQASDLYAFVKYATEGYKNIEWRFGQVKSVTSFGMKGSVELETGTITGDWVFNSIIFPNDIPVRSKGYHLLQHFTGWMIETSEECFEPAVTTYMDFRISQEEGTSFMYVLPVSKTKALVEYTLFTEKLLPINQYEKVLEAYIQDQLEITNYRKVHEEHGVIPMTNHRFPLQKNRIVYMGTAGGQVKGSSGYAFSFIQKRVQHIIGLLMDGDHHFNRRSWNDKKFHLYDSVLLNILHHRKMQGDKIFAAIFQHNSPERVLRFLDNETHLVDDLKIMQSVPAGIFLPAAIHELFQ